MRRQKWFRSDYELALTPPEMLSPEECAYTDSKPDTYWADVISRGERDHRALNERIRDLQAQVKHLEWCMEGLRNYSPGCELARRDAEEIDRLQARVDQQEKALERFRGLRLSGRCTCSKRGKQ